MNLCTTLQVPGEMWPADRAAFDSTGGQASENFAVLITTGFLPQKFRDEMRLPWSPQHQRRFVRLFPFNLTLRDLDRRMRTGCPLV